MSYMAERSPSKMKTTMSTYGGDADLEDEDHYLEYETTTSKMKPAIAKQS